MGRNIASKETIENLISNSKKVISDSERILYNAEFIKSKLCNNGLLTNYLQLLFDLLSGSILCIYEVCCDFKSLISTNNVYTKRYHIQMINLSQYEWCVFLRGKDKNGLLFNIIKLLNEQHYSSLELEQILKDVGLLGKKCNVELRTMTAHYDEPNIMYKKMTTINDEDFYAQRVGEQLLIHDMILNYVSPVLQTISKTLCIGETVDIKTNRFESFNYRNIINIKIAETFNHKGKLDTIIAEQISDAWDNIESQKKRVDICEKVIVFLKSKQLDYTRLEEMKSVLEMHWTVSFMRYDLICSMGSYLNANSNLERSINFMRVYRIATGALTHLYGYNEEYREKSIWSKIKLIPEFRVIPLSIEIENNLKILTLHFDSYKRNLFIHYRENVKLNITERWQYANEMNHPKELMQILQLVTLCKNIDQYLISLISLMDSTEKQKNNKILDSLSRIKELAYKNNIADVVEMSDKLLSIVSISDKNL